MNVLLVEDDDLVRVSVADLLDSAGMEVQEASDGEAALAATQQRDPPALVVTDVNLGPGMTGLELSAAVKQRWPSIRVLIISGMEANLIGRELGPCERFLRKPFTRDALLRNIGDLANDPRDC